MTTMHAAVSSRTGEPAAGVPLTLVQTDEITNREVRVAHAGTHLPFYRRFFGTARRARIRTSLADGGPSLRNGGDVVPSRLLRAVCTEATVAT